MSCGTEQPEKKKQFSGATEYQKTYTQRVKCANFSVCRDDCEEQYHCYGATTCGASFDDARKSCLNNYVTPCETGACYYNY